MGSIFCSYYFSNRISRIRKAIENSQIDQLKIEFEKFSKQDMSTNILNSNIDTYGNTPLTLSIETRQLKSFFYILKDLNADPNVPNKFTSLSPLQMCCLTSPFDQNYLSSRLRLKSKSKSLDFLDLKANYQMKDSLMFNKSDDLHIPKKKRNILTNKRLRKKMRIYASMDSAIHSIETETNSDYGNTSLSKAKINQRPIDTDTIVKMIDSLIINGADVNLLSKVSRVTRMPGFESIRYVSPLHVAVYNQNTTAVNLLIKNGCNVNQCDPVSKITPLHMACHMSKLEIVDALLQSKSIDLEFKSRNGFNCLHWLALSDNDENNFRIGTMLLSSLIRKYESMYGSNSSDFLHVYEKKTRNFVNQQGVELNQTPLMLACYKNKINLVKILLDYDAIIDAKDKNGNLARDYGQKNESCAFLLNSFCKFRKLTMKRMNQSEENKNSISQNQHLASESKNKIRQVSLSSLIDDTSETNLYKTAF